MLGSLGSPKLSVVAALAVLGFVLVATPTSAAPARTMATLVKVTNTALHPVPVAVTGTPDVNVTNTPAVTIDPAGNAVDVGTPTVKLDPSQNTVQVSGPLQMEQPTPFHFYRAIPTPGAAGGKACTPYNLPAGTHDRIDHVTATTYNDAGAVVYIRYLAKIGNSVSQVLTLRVLTNANGDDPYPNTRSGILEWGAHVAGGDVFSVQFGEVHTLEACIQSSPGASASGSITLDGVQE